MSLNDVPAVREIFAAFAMTEVETIYQIGQREPRVAPELIITPQPP